MTPNPKKTTVHLLHQDQGGAPDPYLKFLAGVPELTAEAIEKLPKGFGTFVRMIKNLDPMATGVSGFSQEALRGLLMAVSNRTKETFDPELAGLGATARDLLDRFFPDPKDHATPQDLDTIHTEVIPLPEGPEALEGAVRETAWANWRADRRRLLGAGSVLTSDLDVLMDQLWVEGVDVEEAEAAVVDLLTRDSDTRLKRELMKLDRKERAKTLGDLASLALKTPPA